MVDVAADEVAAPLQEAAASTVVIREPGLCTRRVVPCVSTSAVAATASTSMPSGAIALAGRPRGWREVAERAVAAVDSNGSRDEAVFVQGRARRDIDRRFGGTGDASRAVVTAPDLESWLGLPPAPTPERTAFARPARRSRTASASTEPGAGRPGRDQRASPPGHDWSENVRARRGPGALGPPGSVARVPAVPRLRRESVRRWLTAG